MPNSQYDILLDENIGVKTADFLLKLGYNVKSVAETLRGREDRDILSFAFKEKRIIITQDKDFCDLIFRDILPCYGIILLRLNNESPAAINKVLNAFFENNKESLRGKFVVLNETAARVRGI